MDDQTPHIIFLPSPGMGHFFPALELAKRLVLDHHFSATFLIFPDLVPKWSAQEPFLQSLPTNLNYLLLPPPNFDSLPPNMMLDILGILSVPFSLTSIREVISDLKSDHNVVALVVDLFGTDAFDIAKEFKIPSYVFYTSTAMCLSFSLSFPKIDQSFSGEFRELVEPIRIPGCIPIPGRDLIEPTQERKSIGYNGFLQCCKNFHLADGILVNTFLFFFESLVNTFQELESGALNGLREEDYKPMIYPVGPIVQSDSTNTDSKESAISNWLDAQPPDSVLYISFGSHWTLTQAQMNELALGLEMSETRFLWVIRHPKDDENRSTRDEDPLTYLPEGFVERTKRRGLLVPNWVSQQTILGHESTGGFVTHCGWNSVLESLGNGVPMIAWPLGAEQNMNALFLTEGAKVAIEVKSKEENGVVGRVEIAKIVKNLIEGEEGKQLRHRAKELKLAAKMALDEGGSSYNSLADLASKWKTK